MALMSGGVFIAGLGGLGGWLLEHMLRLGPEFVRAADGDVFDESNLDRQLLSAQTLIGRSKAAAAKERAELVAPQLRFEAVPAFVTEENCTELLSGCCLALDGLDNVAGRLTLERGCAELGIPLVHGAVGGWFFQAGTVPPRKRHARAALPRRPRAGALAHPQPGRLCLRRRPGGRGGTPPLGGEAEALGTAPHGGSGLNERTHSKFLHIMSGI